MKFSQAFKLSTRMFKARTSRTLLTILGMSVGIGAILFLVSFGYGLQKTLLERITTSDSLLTLDVSESKSGAVSLDKESVEEMRTMPGVERVSPAFRLNAQGNVGSLSADMSTLASDASFLKLSGFKMTAGKLFDDAGTTDVIVSGSVVEVFGKSADEMLGSSIRFSFLIPTTSSLENRDAYEEIDYDRVDVEREYTVVGIVEGQENIAYLNSASLGELGVSRYGQVKVKCRSNQEMSVVREAVLEKGFLVSSLSETVDQANQIFSVLQIILMLFGVIALVVSAIGMFNTMTITLLERTEEIGIMKSIGASDRSVAFMFFMESAIMGFLGGLTGVSIGWLGGFIFNVLINFLATRFGGEPVSLFYSPGWFVTSVVMFSTIVGLLTGLAPARRASRIDPLDALRYK